MDIGSSSKRFKDLYLSGGAYLGGTGAANKLDDYEEGTWTPTSGGSGKCNLFIQARCYTLKLGRKVTDNSRPFYLQAGSIRFIKWFSVNYSVCSFCYEAQ